MTKVFLFFLFTATFCTGCDPYKKFKSANPTPINAKRIMFIVMPIEEVGLPLGSFFAVCDSVFKKNSITKMAITVQPENFEDPQNDPITKNMLAFKPDCLILFTPDKFERTQGLYFVKYRTFIMPVKPADYLLPDHAEDYKKKDPTYVNTVKLTAIRSMERDRKNGINAAKKFLNELKKHVSNFQ